MPFEAYATTIAAIAALAGLMLVQILVADVVGIKRRHVPGTPPSPDHADMLFRATRTVANLNESVAAFILLVMFCMLSGAAPGATAVATWIYVVSRIAYAACYYGNIPTLRSVSFGISLLALFGLLGLGLFTR